MLNNICQEPKRAKNHRVVPKYHPVLFFMKNNDYFCRISKTA